VTLPWSFLNNRLNGSVKHSSASLNEISISAYSNSQEFNNNNNRFGELTPEQDGTIVMNAYKVVAVNEVLRRYLTKSLPSSGSMSLDSMKSGSNLKFFKFKLHSQFGNAIDDLKQNYFYKLINLEGRYKVYYSLLINSEHGVEYDFTIETDTGCGMSADGNNVATDADASGSFDTYTTTSRLPNKFKLNDRVFSKRQLCRNTTGCRDWVSLEAGSTFCILMRNTRFFRDSEAYLVLQFVPQFNIETKEVKQIYSEISSWFPWGMFFLILGVLLLLGAIMTVAMK